jgi:hypothetical protein
MLPQFYRVRYQEFSQALEQLQQTAAPTNLDRIPLHQRFEQVQQLFHQQILCLDTDELAPADIPRVQSYLTEINKQMRLLGMDITFLQAARQSATKEERLVQIGSRIQTLIGYCQAVLKLGNQ